MSELSAEPMYAGEFSRNLDAKNRVAVPSRWRFEGDDRDVFLAWYNKKDACVTVFPPAKTLLLREKLKNLKTGNDKARRLIRELFGKASQFGCDAQGRIKLDDRLVDSAGIDKTATLVGNGDHFEIWSSDRYTALEEEEFDVLDAMDELDI